MQRLRRKRKRGSYWTKHRNDVSRWLDNVVAMLNKKRAQKRRAKLYDSVIECFDDNRRKR